MNLIELHPHWMIDTETSLPMLWFDCPAHLENARHDWVAIRVTRGPAYEIPANGAGFPTDRGTLHVWHLEGIFPNITITPSINMKDHWHGFVTNGEITNA